MSVQIDVDLYTSGGVVPTVVHAKRYDYQSRYLVCRVWQNGARLTTLNEAIIEVSCLKANGAVTTYRSDEDEDVITVLERHIMIILTPDMVDNTGNCLLDVTLTDGEDARLGLFQIALKVDESDYEGGGTTHTTLTAFTHEMLAAYTHEYIESGEL